MKIFFDVSYLYYLCQYLPVYRALEARGIESRFVAYERKRQSSSIVHAVIERLGLPVIWVDSQEGALAVYRSAQPDWVVFGHGFDPLADLPEATLSAQLHHGIGMKADVYDADLFDMDVRFTEGPHYTEVLSEAFPRANLVEVGYAKVDPLFWPPGERTVFDLEGAGLDPARPTVMYAPTAFPSSFGAMSKRFPADFGDYNLIVKAHQFSYFNPKYADHRRQMVRWSKAPNVHVVAPAEFDPNPYFLAADLLISDASSVLFEFAATGKPVVWNDFFKLRLHYRGPFKHRLERRMDRAIERYADICAHAPSYSELGRVVKEELARPERFAARRREYTERLIGPTDGHAGERVVEHLLQHALEPSEA